MFVQRPERCPSVTPWLLALIPVALAIDLGDFHTKHHSDSVIPSLVSTVKWTPFFWDQNRLGMLLPLLALPFQNPLTNLLVQCGMSIWFGLATFFLLARYLVRDAAWPCVALGGALSFLALTSELTRFEHLAGHHPYFISMSLALAAMLVTVEPGRPRLIAGMAFIVLAAWVNFTVALILAPMVFVRGALSTERPAGWRLPSETNRHLAMLFAASVIGFGMSRIAKRFDSVPFILPPTSWPSSWMQIAQSARTEYFDRGCGMTWPVFLPLAAIAGLLLSKFRLHRQWVVSALAAGVGAVTSALAIGTLEWTARNGYLSRYWFGPIILAQAALMIVAVAPLMKALNARPRWLAVCGMPMLVAMSLWRYGPPSPEGVRSDLDRTIGQHTRDMLSADCTHIIGNFWDVWPSVLHANIALYDRDEERRIWGVSFRAAPTRHLWMDMPREQMRLAIARVSREPGKAKDDVALALRVYFQCNCELVDVETLPTIRVVKFPRN